MHRIRWNHLAGIGLILASAIGAQAARAEVTVGTTEGASGTTAVISPTGNANTRFWLHRFSDAPRIGFRVQQLSAGDPSISSTDPDCDHNPVFNDVVCEPFPDQVVIDTTAGNDHVQIGGTNGVCFDASPTPVDVDLKAGNDRLDSVSTCFDSSPLDGGPLLTPRYLPARGGSGNDTITGDAFNDTVNGDAGDDTVTGLKGADTLDGGPGADNLTGNASADTLRGGDGNDVLTGEGVFIGPSGDDTLEGGPGADTLRGNENPDILRGGSDGDNLDGGTADDDLDGGSGADTVHGGSGADTLVNLDGSSPDTLNGGSNGSFNAGDTLSYAASLGAPVGVTIDGAANDGAAGEGDNVLGIEKVIGTPGGDDLTGSIADETLEGRIGNDEIEGEGGEDTLSGGDGDDLIDSRDGVPEFVRCGSGFDGVEADLEDTFPAPTNRGPAIGGPTGECEDIERFAVDDGPPARIRNRSVVIRRNRTTRLRLTCPRRARVTCRGRLRLTPPGSARRRIASARYRIRRGRARTIHLRLSRRAAARARKGGTLVARTRERGVSKKGPRGTIRWLQVRRRR